MTLRLVIEHSPHPQPVSELSHPGGELSIGRGADADWRLEDPDMFISRKHCLIAEDGGGFTVTDISRGGVFVDGADAPLGAGQGCALRDGMRIRLGDVVIRADLRVASRATAAAVHDTGAFSADDFFAQRPVEETQQPRPADLPDPFDAPRTPPRPAGARPAAGQGFDDPFTLDPLPLSASDAAPAPGGSSDDAAPAPPVTQMAQAPPAPRPTQPAASPTEAALVEALVRGLGLDPATAGELGPAEMEALGRRFRGLVELIEQALRSRAREKRNLRVAQTVIGSANVNPLKFLPTTDAMIVAMIGPPRPGYMDADAAIAAAGRDLADHQMRSWSGLQAALRRMIDRFDPEEIEREIEATGRLRAILAGGRSALLWQLYCERYKGIAKAAEDRFLGEVGGDFRDAYEGKGRMDHD